jgi:uncharacterized protein (TIRG00374 family)
MKMRYFDFRFLVGIFIIIVLLLYFYGPVSEHINTLNPSYVFLGLATLLAVIGIKQLKWRLLLGKTAGWRLAVKSYFTGQFVNEIAPMGVGDLTKAYIVRKYSKKSFGHSLSVPYMERIIDIVVLSSFAILSSLFLFFFTISSYMSLISLLVAVLAAGFFMLAAFPVRIANILKRIMESTRHVVHIRLVERIISKLEKFILEVSKDFQEAIKSFGKRKKFIFAMLIMAVADWTLEGVCQLFLLNSMGYSIPVLVSVGIVSISWLVSIPSMIPGGLGIRETVLSLLSTAWGIPFSAALVSVLVYRGMVVLIFGSGTLISLRIKIK